MVGVVVDDAKSKSEIQDGSVAVPKTDIDRLGHSVWECWVCWRAIFAADLMYEGLLSD